ncbi:L-dopachrome tautomerase-related protein [Frateuria aurantia]
MTTLAAAPEARSSTLHLARQSMQMPWNAVAVDARGRFIVSSPRWTGYKGPAVAIIDAHGQLSAYPDAAWNRDPASAGAGQVFVSVNAIHEDRRGDLWIVDTGALQLGGTPVPGGAKIVHVDPHSDRVVRVYHLPGAVLHAHSYIDDIRIHGRRAYLTDAGEGAILVLDLDNGQVRRRFDGMPFVRARAQDRIVVQGKPLLDAHDRPVHVQVDPLELSPDGRVLYFGPLTGPWSQVETRYLDDDGLDDAELARHVRPWLALPPVGGTAMGPDGSLYYTPLADASVMRRNADGQVSRLVQDRRLRWVDAPFLDGHGHLYLPVPQLDGAAAFNHGRSTMQAPFKLYRLDLPGVRRPRSSEGSVSR